MAAFFSLMDSDLNLLSRYHRLGDAEAFQALVSAHAAMVHGTAQRITHDAVLAQDVAQETFLALARSSGVAIRSVGAWLHHVALMKAQNAVRAEARRLKHESAAANLNQPGADSSWAEIEPLLDETLAELPEATRALLIERYLEGQTQQDIAARLGVSQSTVSRQLDEAIHQLRDRLKTKGILGLASLASILSTPHLHAVPPALTASLSKISLTGIGTSSAIPAASVTTTLITMTATTKILISSTAVATIGFFLIPQFDPNKPAPQDFVSEAKATNARVAASAPQPKRYRPEASSAELQRRVDEFIRKFEGLPFERMMASFEFEEAMQGMAQFLESPANQKMIREAVEEIKKAKNMQHGMLNIAIDTEESLGSPKNRALIEASMSRDPKKIEGWLRGALEGAIFEYSYDPDLKKPAGSISVQETDRLKSLERK